METTRPVQGPQEPPDLPGPLRSFQDDPDVARMLRLERVGGCRILRLIGEGGMGMVFLAEQEQPIKRTVAVKIIRLGLDTRRVVSRFQAERQALARMDHPSIAKVHEAGSSEDGRPYFVMEYVPGEPITAFCDRRRLSVRERLELFREVCRGVQHAHHKGILHRDLKPSNILVAEVDGVPRPKIIDFGVAKSLDPDQQGATLLTGSGEFLGTPEYASPEQAGGHDLDTRADIYALGVLLHELLLGEVPLAWERRSIGGLPRFLERVQAEEPARPSRRALRLGERAAAVAAGRGLRPEQLARRLHGDLDWIVLKALEKDPNRRYATAAEFEADLGRYLRCEPVQAKGAGTLDSFWKAVRRHRGKVAAAGAVLIALLAGLVASTALYLQAAARYREVLRLSDAALGERLLGAAEHVHWPLYPVDGIDASLDPVVLLEARLAPMRARLAEAEELCGRLPAHRRNLAAMRAAAEERPNEPGKRPDLSTLEQLRLRSGTLRAARSSAREPEAAALEREIAASDAWIAVLETKVAAETSAVKSWRHPDPAEDWRLQQETLLVEALERLAADDPQRSALADMRIRFAHAQGLVALTLGDRAWAEAAAAIAANPVYGGLVVPPQLGLVPLGEDPGTGLWEFWHVPSGERPERAERGPSRWRMEAPTGMVLVLLPGGGFSMGARRPGQGAGPNVDPAARRNEYPVHTLDLDPFFLSKYEVTQAQWTRCCRRWFKRGGLDKNRSFFQATRDGVASEWPIHPAEQVLPSDAQEALQRMGLTLPTEAQWEYACRAGSASPWCLPPGGMENLADASYRRHFDREPGDGVEWDDGFPFTAPVGSFPPNPFGLHDLLGNVSEACLDLHTGYDQPPERGTGRRWSRDASSHQVRGGNFRSGLGLARSAARNPEAVHGAHIGARAARPVTGFTRR